MKYLIWNLEHGAWWKAHGNGYTPNRSEAGRYELGEATQICIDANCHLKPHHEPMEAIVPEVAP